MQEKHAIRKQKHARATVIHSIQRWDEEEEKASSRRICPWHALTAPDWTTSQ